MTQNAYRSRLGLYIAASMLGYMVGYMHPDSGIVHRRSVFRRAQHLWCFRVCLLHRWRIDGTNANWHQHPENYGNLIGCRLGVR